jgi:outer membrane protein assembly factor BamB
MYLRYVSPFLVYNSGRTMVRSHRSAVLAATVLAVAAGAVAAQRPLVDPFPLRFPLVEAGSLEIEGRVAGQPWAREGIVYFATSDGSLTAVVVPSRSVLWLRQGPGGRMAPAPRSVQEGRALTLRAEGNHVQALDAGTTLIWDFAADGRITAEPAVAAGRVYFGTENRRFYGLKAATGKTVWSRRLQGEPLHPAVVRDGTVAVPASNSVVYFLSARGGSLLSWENVASRVIHPLAAAGPLILVSSASPEVVALEIKTGKRIGQYVASGPLVAGAVWSPPYVVVFVEDGESGRQRLVFLRSR